MTDPSGLRGIAPHLLDRARMLLSNIDCGKFLQMVHINLGLPPNLDDLLHAFYLAQFLPTPKGDPFVKHHGKRFTAHVDVIGQSNVVHVDNPAADNAPVTLLHEVFYTIYYGLFDYSFAKAAGYTGSNNMEKSSDYTSKEMESHCKECKK
jgi:hypothetical protein